MFRTPLPVTVTGTSLTWHVPLTMFKAKPGTLLSALEARVEPSEPVTGYLGGGIVVFEEAMTDKTWRVG